MSKNKDSLLTEAQVRKFMKLAALTPLSHGFVEGMGSYRDDDNPEEEVEESHGRSPDEGPAGRGKPDQNARPLEEQGFDDLGDEEEVEPEGDLGLGDEEEVEMEDEPMDEPLDEPMDEPAGDGRQVSVDDFLSALETALEDVLGDEVEVDQEEAEEEPVEEPEEELGGEEELEMEMGPEEEEEEMPLQEMIDTITKRVAKRIIGEALKKKK